jgi:hypothetical protein
MPAPVYNGGGYRRGWGNGHHWGQTPGPADNGWFDDAGSWLGGNTPQYAGAGQPASGTIGSGTPAYLQAPMTIATADAATTALQAITPVIVVPRS